MAKKKTFADLMAEAALQGTTTSDLAELLKGAGVPLPNADLGPVSPASRAGRTDSIAPTQETQRPNDYMAPVAELLSIPMGAYGAGQLVGSGVNAVSEGDYASGAGQVALGMAGMLPMAPKGGKGIRAFHGSPHDFDRFSMEHIGKGEGAQAYGHGLYFAEAEDVARSYRENLTRGVRTGSGPGRIDVFTVDGAEVPASQKSVADIAHTMREYSIDPNTADGLDWLQREVGARGLPFETIEQAANLYKRDITRNTVDGRMYEVNIKADPESFIDYDRPLGQQSEAVRRALDEAGLMPYTVVDQAGNRLDFSKGMPKAEAERFAAAKGGRAIPKDDADFDAVRKAQMMTGRGDAAQADIATALREAGIPGIRYLDQMSRGEGKGSSNYVVFDDAIIDIVKKYGIAGLALLQAAGYGTNEGEETQ